MCPNFVHFQIGESTKNLMHYIIVKMYIVCHNWSHNCSALVFAKVSFKVDLIALASLCHTFFQNEASD